MIVLNGMHFSLFLFSDGHVNEEKHMPYLFPVFWWSGKWRETHAIHVTLEIAIVCYLIGSKSLQHIHMSFIHVIMWFELGWGG